MLQRPVQTRQSAQLPPADRVQPSDLTHSNEGQITEPKPESALLGIQPPSDLNGLPTDPQFRHKAVLEPGTVLRAFIRDRIIQCAYQGRLGRLSALRRNASAPRLVPRFPGRALQLIRPNAEPTWPPADVDGRPATKTNNNPLPPGSYQHRLHHCHAVPWLAGGATPQLLLGSRHV